MHPATRPADKAKANPTAATKPTDKAKANPTTALKAFGSPVQELAKGGRFKKLSLNLARPVAVEPQPALGLEVNKSLPDLTSPEAQVGT